MADIAGSYDQNAEPNQFERIPAGDYRAKIIESDIVDISAQRDVGRCLKLTWQIETGPHDGRLIWQRLNMYWIGPEKTPGEVVRIANGQFAAVRQATGIAAPQRSEELHHIPCLISIGPQKNDPNYDEVKSVKPVSGVAASPAHNQRQQPAVPQHQQRTAAPQNGGGSAPWRKSA